MHTTRTADRHGRLNTNRASEPGLTWLLEENERAAERSRRFRDAREEEEMLLMRRPVAAREAYADFGLLLGTLPPAAIFIRLFGGALLETHRGIDPGPLFLLLLMNVFCAVAGRHFGSRLSRLASAAEELRRAPMIFGAAGVGFMWGAATGAVGGLPAYGFGAIFGAVFAVPVGMLAFALFAPLHRLLARGGMIDARHLWPLIFGVVTFISALILGM